MAYIDVLIVEDDDSVRASEAELLRSMGFSVAEANDSLVALALLESHEVAALVVDVYMSDLNGLWLLDQLDDPPPVVLVTAHDYDRELLSRRDKFFSYLQKPVEPPVLLEAMATAVEAGRRG